MDRVGGFNSALLSGADFSLSPSRGRRPGAAAARAELVLIKAYELVRRRGQEEEIVGIEEMKFVLRGRRRVGLRRVEGD